MSRGERERAADAAARVHEQKLVLLRGGAHLFERRALSGREGCGSERNDGDLAILRILPQMLNDCKRLHTCHEQVEQDNIGMLPGNDLQRCLAVRRGDDLIRLTGEKLTDKVCDLWVIVNHQQATAAGRDAG